MAMAAPRQHQAARAAPGAERMLPGLARGEGFVLLEVRVESPEDMDRNLQSKVAHALQQELDLRGLQKDELGEPIMTITDKGGRVYHSRASFEQAFPGGPGRDEFPMSVSVQYEASRRVVVVEVLLAGPLEQDWETEVASSLAAAKRAKAAKLCCTLGDEPVSIALIDSSGQRFASKEDLEAAYEEQDSPPEDAFPMRLLVTYDRKGQDTSASSCLSDTTSVADRKFYAARFTGNWAQKDPDVVRIQGRMLHWPSSRGKRDDAKTPIQPVDGGNDDSTSFVMTKPCGRTARATLHKGTSSCDKAQDELRWDDGEVWTRVVHRRPSKSWVLFQEHKMQHKRFSSVSKVAVGFVLACLVMAAWAGGIAISALQSKERQQRAQQHARQPPPSPAPPPAPPPAPTRPPAPDAPPAPAAPGLPAEVRELRERLAAAEQQRAAAEGAAERERQRAQAAWSEADEKAREADQKVREAGEKAREADEKATAAKKAAKATEARYSQSNTGRLTRFLDWLGSLPFQGALALAAGTAGMLAVVGPSSFARLFLALWGSTVAALLAGAAFALLVDRTAGGGNLGSFTDAVVTLVQGGEGRGSDLVGCLVWLVLTVLGIVRWATSFECALYALLDEVKMDADGTLLIDDRDNLRLPLVDSAHKEVANGRSARR